MFMKQRSFELKPVIDEHISDSAPNGPSGFNFNKMKNIVLTTAFIAAIFVACSGQLFAQEPAQPASAVTWKATTIDLGKIPQGKPVNVEFEFTNPSMTPLIINSVRPNCGCTVANYPKEPIAPGKSGKIVLTYNAAGMGVFTKSTNVSTNASEGTTVLIIKGEVIKTETAVN
jgi:hypothetical protein